MQIIQHQPYTAREQAAWAALDAAADEARRASRAYHASRPDGRAWSQRAHAALLTARAECSAAAKASGRWEAGR